MVRQSRKKMKGGDKIEDIQSQLDDIQKQVNELKTKPVSEEMPQYAEEMPQSAEEMPQSAEDMPQSAEEMPEEVKPEIGKPWTTDNSIKFDNGVGGRVKLSFDRIMTLLDNNIKKGNNKKNWGFIKNKMLDANSEEEVQDIINNHTLDFGSNYVAGTRRKRKHNKKRTSKTR